MPVNATAHEPNAYHRLQRVQPLQRRCGTGLRNAVRHTDAI